MLRQIFPPKLLLIVSACIVLSTPSAVHGAPESNENRKLRRAIAAITSAVSIGNFQNALDSAREESIDLCLKYLLAAFAIGKKYNYKDTDFKEFQDLYDVAECEKFTEKLMVQKPKNCDKVCSAKECEKRGFPFCSKDPVCDECSDARALPTDELRLYKMLTDDGACDEALAKIRQQSRNFNDEPHKIVSRRNDMIGRALLGAAVPPIVAGSLLFGLSYAPRSCYGSEPTNSDGKAPSCVYPDNYKIGAPILWGIGLGLGIAGTVYQVKKQTEKAKIGAPTPADSMRATCPAPLPPSWSPAAGGAL